MTQAIIVIGGFNSLWPAYLTMARHLEDISGLQAVGVPLMPWHWWAASRNEDATNILHMLEETVAWARRRFHAERFILVGHSAGGLIARLYLHQEPVWGHVYAGVEHVDAVITLGSPHCGERSTATGWYLSDEANRLVPGTPYTGRVRYRAVAGQAIEGRRYGRFRQRQAYRAYAFFAGQGDLWGDGTVPLDCMRLDGAETVTLEGVSHSLKTSRHWYGGSPAIIRRWWPQELTDGR